MSHSRTKLNPKLTFPNLMIGPNNRLAHAVALAVAQDPGRAHNPLFLYGKKKLLKTHLLQAIAHYVWRRKHMSFAYLSAEQFANECSDAISNAKITRFRRKYGNKSVLLVEDIHLLVGRKEVQEQFLRIFNTMYDAHRQIVVSSDMPPDEIPALDGRLRGRLESGFIADVWPLDLEQIIAMFTETGKRVGTKATDETVTFVDQQVKASIRRSEGCLSNLSAHTVFSRVRIDKNMAEDVLDNVLIREKP